MIDNVSLLLAAPRRRVKNYFFFLGRSGSIALFI